MFKKGQLVKAVNSNYFIVESKSAVFPGAYRVSFIVDKLGRVTWFGEDELTLIGNNFKFKGAK